MVLAGTTGMVLAGTTGMVLAGTTGMVLAGTTGMVLAGDSLFVSTQTDTWLTGTAPLLGWTHEPFQEPTAAGTKEHSLRPHGASSL